MARMIHCIKLGREAEGLDFPPYPGELGKRIYEHVSKEAQPDARVLAAHLLYLQDILELPQINTVYWTLCMEIQFYLIFCLLMFRILFTCPLYSQESMEQSWETLKQLQVRQEIQVVDMNLKSLKGTLVGVSNEAISLRVENDETIQRANVLRVSLREKPNRSRNALIGLGMGAAAGLVAGVVAGDSETRWGRVIILAPIGAAIVSGVGAVLPIRGYRTIYRAKRQ